MSTQSVKKYGLIVPQKKNSTVASAVTKRPAALPFFQSVNDDDDAEDSVVKTKLDDIKRVNRLLQEKSTRVDKGTDLIHANAIAEDGTVFDYDGVYETFAKDESRTSKSVVSKSLPKAKYVENLMSMAKVREKESERVYERRLLKERKEDDEQFQDKAKYMTSAYKQKLIEDQRWNYEDRLAEEIEKRTDVRSGKGMQAFYSNLLTKNVSMGGDVSKSAVSAYTAGSTRQQQLVSGENQEAQEDDPVVVDEKSVHQQNEAEENPNPKLYQAETPASDPPHDLDVVSTTAEKDPIHTASVPREEIILSAKERYLARKKARTS